MFKHLLPKAFLLLTVLFVFAGSSQLRAQNTVGLLSNVSGETYDGYTLFFPHNQGTVWLIDMCGEVVHQWDDPSFRPGNTAYLQPDGNIIVCKGNGPASNPYIHAGGGGEVVEIRDWDNNLLWQYTVNDSLMRLHHDVSVMPNGNILMIAWEKKTGAEALALGRDPSYLIDGELWPDYIIEVEPVGLTGGNIVWEWHAWDHMIQDFDATKPNFGVVADHPELIDINKGDATGTEDWHHSNAIDYNPDLDQIMLSVPEYNEFWIIDHSTTTLEAAGSTGGLSGMGGDLMYRWGNPAAYNQGTAADQKLFFQHDPHWMDVNLPPTHPDYGKVAVYNNQVGADFSAIATMDLGFDIATWSYPKIGDVYGPADFEWTWTHPYPQDMYSTGLSGLQRLANGNTFMVAGRQGYMIEINPAGEIVWEYKTPLVGGSPVPQGTVTNLNQNLTFRAYRYDPSYPAFTGRTLTPYAFIETSPTIGVCADMDCPIPANLTSVVSGSGVALDWNNVNQAAGYRIQGRPVGAGSFGKRISFSSDVSIAALAPGTYEWQVQSGCDDGAGGFQLSDFSPLQTFTITAPRAGTSADFGLAISAYPVPAVDVLNVELQDEAIEAVATVVAMDGRELSSTAFSGNRLMLDVADLPAGMYMLTISAQGNVVASQTFAK